MAGEVVRIDPDEVMSKMRDLKTGAGGGDIVQLDGGTEVTIRGGVVRNSWTRCRYTAVVPGTQEEVIITVESDLADPYTQRHLTANQGEELWDYLEYVDGLETPAWALQAMGKLGLGPMVESKTS